MDDIAQSLNDALAGRYRIERELGQGGMAVVYLAFDLKRQRQVALKVIQPELAGLIGRTRFEREIRVAGRLEHPHICPVYESGATDDDLLWYTMPYLPGASLRRRMREEKTLPVDDAVRIIREAAQALEFAHRQGVIHRDIKPENLLLAENGSTLVADFGIAKGMTTGDGHTATRLTDTGVVLGTPAYMSPEQRLGAPLDGRTDVYSLALTLYELLLGDLPSSGGGAGLDLFLGQMTDAGPHLRYRRMEISDALEAVVRKGIAPDPARRYQSMGEFIAALEAAGAGPGRGRVRRLTLACLAVVGVVGVVAAGRALWLRRTTSRSPRLVVVLPVEAQDDSTLTDIGWSLGEDLRRALLRLPGLGVVSDGATRRVTGGRLSARDIASRLGAEIVVQPTVARTSLGYDLSLAVSRPAADERSGRATLTGSLRRLMDRRDSMLAAVTTLAGERFDPEVLGSAGRYRIATEDTAAYLRYARTMRQDRPGRSWSRSTWQATLDREDSILVRDPLFIEALSDRGTLGLRMRAALQPWLSAEESARLLQDATTLLRRAQSVDETHPFTDRLAGYVMLANGDTTGAVQALRRAAENLPLSGLIADLCEVELTGIRPPAPLPSSCRRLVQADSLDPQALESAARLFQAGGRFEEALEAARAAFRLEPAVAVYRTRAAAALRSLRREDEAMMELRGALAADPAAPTARRALVQLLLDQERPEEALVAAQAAVRASRGDITALEVLSLVQSRLGQRDSSIGTARRALALDPTAPATHHLVGQRLWEAGRIEAALAEFATVVRLEPRNADPLFFLAGRFLLAGRTREAEAALERGTSLVTGAPAASAAMARHLQWLGRTGAAITAWRKAVAGAPEATEMLVSLAYAEVLGGHADSAMTTAASALGRDSTRALAWSTLALARYLTGDHAGAIASSDRYRAAAPYDQRAIAEQIWFYARGGRAADAGAKLDSLEHRMQTYAPSAIPRLIAYAGVNDTARARDVLARSSAGRDEGWLDLSLDDPRLDLLKRTPEFAAAQARLVPTGGRRLSP